MLKWVNGFVKNIFQGLFKIIKYSHIQLLIKDLILRVTKWDKKVKRKGNHVCLLNAFTKK